MIARRRALQQLMVVPWRRFHKTYNEYIFWEALTLWVRTVVEVNRGTPELVRATLSKHCPGFLENKGLSKESVMAGVSLDEWIQRRVFAGARREGWLDALVFYVVRDIRSQNAWEYWEHCDQEWRRRPPSACPSFKKWLSTAQNYGLDRETTVGSLLREIERYVEWTAFSSWLESLTEATTGLPKHMETELDRRCPGFREQLTSNSTTGRKALPIGRDLMTWVEDHFFPEAKRQGRLDTIREQARLHPRSARIAEYAKRWKNNLSSHSAKYRSFSQWCRTAENYTEA